MKTIYLLLLILLSSVVLTECKVDDRPNNLRFGLSSAPISLDPRFATDATSSRINRLLYRSLVDFDENLRPIPDLADWEQITPTHYRFNLNEDGRQFHNGSRLTAYDIEATYNFILAEKNASPHRGTLKLIKLIKVLNSNIIDFILKKPDTLFPGRLTVGILPISLINSKHPFNKKPVGSGQFEFVKWSQSSHLYLKRRRDERIIEFLEVKDPVVRVLKLARGEIDMLQNDLSPELVTWLNNRSDIKVAKKSGSNFAYLGFNLDNEITGQLLIRQAIAYAINREEIIQYILGNAARPANSFLFPTNHWAGYKGELDYSFNPDQARKLLKQAGFSLEQPLKLSYKTSNNPLRIRVATVIQQQLASVGIDMDLRTYDWGTFYGDIKAGHFQTYSLAWVGIKMPDIFHYVFHSDSIPPNGANRGRLKNIAIDNLIDAAGKAMSLETQAVFYQGLQIKLFEELPYVPLWYEDYILATRQQVEFYNLAADGNYDGLNQVTWYK